METKIFDVRSIINNANGLLSELEEAAQMLAEGKTVAFPTETVYGLGANALDPAAVSKIFEAKGRPSDNPLIVHIASIDQLHELVSEIPDKAMLLMKEFWPGPLSIIMQKTSLIPESVTAGLDTVAIRMPKNSEAFILLKLANCPVAAPSANISGKPSPTKPEHIIHDLMGKADGLVLGRDSDAGIESTVIDMCSEPPVILRPGIITKEDIEAVIGPVKVAGNRDNSSEVPKAPGMKYTHYAPNAPMTLFEGDEEKMFKEICAQASVELANGKRIGIISTDATHDRYLQAFGIRDGSKTDGDNQVPGSQADSTKIINQAIGLTMGGAPREGGALGQAEIGICDGELSSAAPLVISAGSRNNLKTVAHNIFDILRLFDSAQVDVILAESFGDDGLGFSIMNRMSKAATSIK